MRAYTFVLILGIPGILQMMHGEETTGTSSLLQGYLKNPTSEQVMPKDQEAASTGARTGLHTLEATGGNLWIAADHYPNGWSSLPWFGYFYELEQDWIYHLEHGYVYCIGDSTENMFFYDSTVATWNWSSSQFYPYLYKYGNNEGWYRYYVGGRCGNRWFWRSIDGVNVCETEINEPAFGPAPEGFSLVPPGEFLMGDSFSEGDANELPVHPVTVSGFFIHKTEITYRDFVDVINWAIQQNLAGGNEGVVVNLQGDLQPILVLYDNDHLAWNGSEVVLTDGRDNYPCTMVTWYGAMAYCHYRTLKEGGLSQAVDMENWTMDRTANGYRLPTEAEWEKAARGGLTGMRFSFGNTLSYLLAWWGYSGDSSAPVSSYAGNGYDLYDMTGNVLEWCWDWYSDDYYNSSPSQDPMGPDSGEFRSYRTGGSSAYYCRITSRSGSAPDNAHNYMGFRPVRTPGG